MSELPECVHDRVGWSDSDIDYLNRSAYSRFDKCYACLDRDGVDAELVRTMTGVTLEEADRAVAAEVTPI